MKFFAAKCDDTNQAQRYLIDAVPMHRYPTQDGKIAVVWSTPDQHAEFNLTRSGRRGDDALRETEEEAIEDLTTLYRLQEV